MSIQLTAGTTHTDVGGIVHSHLVGTALCHTFNVMVRVICGNTPGPTKTVPVINGTWTADFSTCACGQQITFEAHCEESPQPPWETLWVGSVPCTPACCPSFATSVVLGDCTGSQRAVRLLADVTVPAGICPDVRVRWHFGDGSAPAPWTTCAAGTTTHFEEPHDYTCGSTYPASLEVSPAGDFLCPSFAVQVEVPCCGCCPSLEVKPTIGPCDGNGHRSVKVDYTITVADPSCPPVEGQLDALGQTVVITSSAPLSGTLGPTPLAPGHYTATLTLTSPRACPPVQKEFDVPPCDCCPASVVTADVAKKCNSDHLTKHVEVEAVITPIPGCPMQAEMSIEGSVVDSGYGDAPFTLHHQGDYDCGRHPVTISYPGTDCPDGGGEFCVPVCELPGCRSHRMYFEMTLTTALIALILYLFNAAQAPYLKTLALGSAILAVIVLLWWLPCLKRCRTCQLLLVLWEVLLATFLGFLMLGKSTYQVVLSALSYYMSTPLAIIVIVLILLLIAFVIYLLHMLWVSRCCPTECERWTEVFEALTYVCLVATGIVTAVITQHGHATLFVAGYVATGVGFLISAVLWKKNLACAP